MAGPGAPDEFFLGYGKKVPRRLAMFMGGVALATAGGFAVGGLALGISVDDPGDGGYLPDPAPRRLVGVLQSRPYPVLRVRPDDQNPVPRTIMLTSGGKHGVQEKADGLDGRMVQASGVILRRGMLDMLQLDGPAALQPVTDQPTFQPAPVQPLGRWRLAGEICDGKCWAGAMRPGQGLAHKACANLCLLGGVPPVFVSSGTVEGSSYFLLAGEDGGALADRAFDLVALPLELEGQVERWDDLLVFAPDLSRGRTL